LHFNERAVGSNPDFFQGSGFIDNRFVVKFAWSEPAARRIAHEGDVLEVLGSVRSLPVPDLIAWSRTPAIVVTRLVSGVPLGLDMASKWPAEQRLRVVDDLARFLVVLHDDTTLNALQNAAIHLVRPVPQADTDTLRARLVRYLDSRERDLVLAWCERIDTVLADPVNETVLHGDLHAYNMVVDPTNGALRLVADFETAGIGDPAYDFRYLPGLDVSIEFFADLVAAYQQGGRRTVDVDRVAAWHIRTVLGDALWRTEADVRLPGGGTPTSWVRALHTRLGALGGISGDGSRT
jgi:aminoglycoside phosphotransferase (APT) family kinase protein